MTTDLGYRTNVRIGTSVATMTDVKVEPQVEYQAGEIERIVSGGTKAVGSPRLVWRYPEIELTGAQFYQLKNLVGDNMSATVYVDVPTNTVGVTTYTPVIATYQCIMQWPNEGVTRTIYNRWKVDEIVFTNLVAV